MKGDNFEKLVIGSILLEPTCLTEIIPILRPEFFQEYHGIYISILRYYANRLPIDVSTLAHDIQGCENRLEVAIHETPSAAHVKFYAEKLREGFLRRSYQQGIHKLAQILPHGEIAEIHLAIEHFLSGIPETAIIRTINTETERMTEEIQRIRKHEIKIIRTQFRDLNWRLGGFRKKQLYTIGGDTSHGKTAFVINLLSNWIKQGYKVLLASYEAVDQNIIRMVSLESDVPVGEIFNADMMSKENEDKYYTASSELLKYNDLFRLLDCPSHHEIVSTIRAFKPDIVIIDYLQAYHMFNRKESRNTTDAMAVGQTVFELRRMAQAEDVVMIELSQLGREKDTNKLTAKNMRYFMSRLKESGYIEQFSSAVMIVFWPWSDEGSKVPEGEYFVYIAKNSNGKKGEVKLRIKPSTQRLSDSVEVPPGMEYTNI